ncbi:MAG TPA: hypothetical protein VK791_07805 [bacterium]|jgi:hypothetical protein|nr:hypothetical protein [bacterium]
MKIFSKYGIVARIFPTIIGLIPLFIFQYFYLRNLLNVNSVWAATIGNASFSTILIYTFNQYFVRIPSKIFEDWLFKKKLYFPTTNFLMYSDGEYSDELKNNIRQKIRDEFSLKLPNKSEEKRDEKSARKRINEANRLMIGKVQDGYLVLQHNIEYGFVRNLWGASLVGSIGALLLISVSAHEGFLRIVGAILAIAYCVYLAFGFLVIKYFGRAYACKLIEEYVGR